MHVYIVRHTSVVLDGNETCYGDMDIDVRPTFEEEASVTRAALEGLSFDGVFSSPLQRARKLADFCGYGFATLDDRLKEMNSAIGRGSLGPRSSRTSLWISSSPATSRASLLAVSR